MTKYHYSNLDVYKTADKLVNLIFDVTNNYPKEEVFNTASQLRRASLSVVLNIVEGNAKRFTSTKEFLRFLNIAKGSLSETEYLLQFSLKRKFLSTETYEILERCLIICSKQLWQLCRYQEKLLATGLTNRPTDPET